MAGGRKKEVVELHGFSDAWAFSTDVFSRTGNQDSVCESRGCKD